MRAPRRIGPHALLIGLFECARGALLFTLLPNHLRFGVGHPMSVVGLALSAYSFTELATKVPSGWVIDRVGRRAPLVGGLGLCILSVLLLAEARQTWAVLAAAALGGLGASPVWPAVVSGLVEATDNGRRGEAVGALLTSWMLGIGVGFVVANFLLEVHGAVAFGFVLGCLLATFPLVLPATRRFPRPGAGGRERMPQQNGTSSEVRWLWPLFAGMVLQTAGGGMLLPILSPYAREVLHLTPLHIGALLAVGPGLTVLLLVPLGRMMDHVGRVEVLSISLGAGAAVLFILPYLRSLWALVPMVALLGLAYATLLPAWNTLVMDLLPPHRRATMLGLAMSLEGLGVAIGTAVGGILWDAYGPAQPFRAAAGVLACVAIGYLLLLPRSLGSPLGHRA